MNLQDILKSHSSRYEKASLSFWTALKNEDKKAEFRLGRMHLGSFAAFGMAVYNLKLLKQRIIKQAIHLTKSKNPSVIKFTKGYLSVLYFCGLLAIWHIPSLSSEVAFRLYYATSSATFSYLTLDNNAVRQMISDQAVKAIMNDLDASTIE